MKKKDDKSSGKGKEVNLCYSMREEVEVPDAIRSAIFLKHPGDKHDDEEEEEGEMDMDMEEESREETASRTSSRTGQISPWTRSKHNLILENVIWQLRCLQLWSML